MAILLPARVVSLSRCWPEERARGECGLAGGPVDCRSENGRGNGQSSVIRSDSSGQQREAGAIVVEHDDDDDVYIIRVVAKKNY
jgi:hypothetical protein